MILATARGGNREVRAFGDPAAVSPPSWWRVGGGFASSGIHVTPENATGLPTVAAAIRLIAETGASLPFVVYEGEDAERRKAASSWQHQLLHEQPNPDQSPFDFLADVFASVESCGNAFVRKLKARGRVMALYVLDPARITVRRDEGNAKVFEISGYGGKRETLDAASVLHVRGFTMQGGDVGMSPIRAHAESFGSALALQQFQGRFFANDASPGSYMQVPGPLRQDQAKEMVEVWNATHAGLANAGRFGILYNGAEMKQLGIPLRDAQFIETQKHASELAARIFLGPAASLLGSDANNKTEEESLRFLNFALRPRLRRVEAAFNSDLDLFGGSPLYPRFHIDEFLRADAATRAQVQHMQIQSGVLLVDEARAEMGMPPLPDGAGQVPQLTPVGGAPNPQLEPVAAMRQLPAPVQREVIVLNEAPDFAEIAASVRELASAERQRDPQVIHIAPAEVTVLPPDVHVAPAQVTVEQAAITVEASPVTVEPAVVNVSPEIRLEVPSRSVTVRRDDGTAVTYTEESD